MKSTKLVTTFVLAAAIGCGSDQVAIHDSGSVAFALEVPEGDEKIVFNFIDYVLRRDDGTERRGRVDLSSSTKLGFVVGGVPPGSHTIVVSSASTDGVTMCLGNSAPFTVVPGMTTSVGLTLSCKQPKRNGGVAVNGKLNICPLVGEPSASPNEVVVGGVIAVDAGGVVDSDHGPAPLKVGWAATPSIGTFDDSATSSTKFHCAAPGAATLTFGASDGDPGCMSSGKVTVVCTSVCPKDDGDPCTTDACLHDGTTTHSPSEWPGCTTAAGILKEFCPEHSAALTDAEMALANQCATTFGAELAQGADLETLLSAFVTCVRTALSCTPTAMSERPAAVLSANGVCNQSGYQGCAKTALETFLTTAASCTALAGVALIPPLTVPGAAAAYVLCVLGAIVQEQLALRLCVSQNSCDPVTQVCVQEMCVDAGIQVVSASYGAGSCGNPVGNVTGSVASLCNGRPSCDVWVHNGVFGDPSYGCAKDFTAEYRCGAGAGVLTANHGPVAGEGYTVSLACP